MGKILEIIDGSWPSAFPSRVKSKKADDLNMMICCNNKKFLSTSDGPLVKLLWGSEYDRIR